ncbi:coiled-coil domain-containing protein [Trifolium repens]|nr:coiled-coil domain-containing protein [Trifolium repens]
MAERKNRHLLDVTRTLLLQASVPSRFWVEALSTAVFLINRLPSLVIEFDSPFFRLFKIQPDYNDLHTFGCVCFVHLPPFERHKLGAQSVQCAFMGYSHSHKGFVCYDVSNRRFRISRNVTFFDDQFMFHCFSPAMDDFAILPNFDIMPQSIERYKPGNVYVRSFSTAQEMWNYLKRIYNQDNAAKHFQLELEIANYRQGTFSIQEYYSGFLNLWTKHSAILHADVPKTSLAAVQEVYNTSKRDQFLMKLRPEFEVVRDALLNRNPVPSLDTCVGELLREEQRHATQGIMSHDAVISEPMTVAYAAQSRGEGRDVRQVQCFSCKQFGHFAHSCSKKFCNYCKLRGHIISDCPTRPPRSTQRPVHAFNATISSTVGSSIPGAYNGGALQPAIIQQMVISALSALGIQSKSSNVSRPWFLDSGASNHMTDSSEYLHNLHSYHGNQKIQIADGNALSITNVGDLNSDFRDVLVSPGLASNLLSVGQLVDNNCNVNFSRDGCLVHEQVSGKREKKGGEVSQAEVFVETRKKSRKGKEVDGETQVAIDKLQESIEKSAEAAKETFHSLFGKERSGRIRCHGRTATPSSLRKKEEIALVKKQYDGKIADMSQKMGAMEVLLKSVYIQQNPHLSEEDVDSMISNALLGDDNSPTPRSSTSTYAPAHLKVRNENDHNQDDDLYGDQDDDDLQDDQNDDDQEDVQDDDDLQEDDFHDHDPEHDEYYDDQH